jgi:antitoxin HigA-1
MPRTNHLMRGLAPTHPGELLRDVILPAIGRPNTEIAQALHVSRQTLQDILAQKQSVTPQMALRLGKLAGNGPDLWLNMQREFDLAAAEKELGAELEDIPTLDAAK